MPLLNLDGDVEIKQGKVKSNQGNIILYLFMKKLKEFYLYALLIRGNQTINAWKIIMKLCPYKG